MTYVMWRRGKGSGVGTTRAHRPREREVASWLQMRALQEHADAAWVVSTHEREAEARAAEAVLSLRYRIPTLPFKARPTRAGSSVVGRPGADRPTSSTRSTVGHGGLAAARRPGLASIDPIMCRRRTRAPAKSDGDLCGDRRGRTPMHRVSLFGGRRSEGATGARGARADRSAQRRAGARSWRFESCIQGLRRRARPRRADLGALDVTVRCVARLGRSDADGNGATRCPSRAPPRRAARHGHVHRGRRLRRRRERRAVATRPAASTTSTSSRHTTSSRTGSSPTTRSTASAAPTSATSSTSRTTSPTRRSCKPRAELPLDADDPRAPPTR